MEKLKIWLWLYRKVFVILPAQPLYQPLQAIKTKQMNQLIDNSTLLEVGEILTNINDYDSSNKEIIERKTENILIFLHALLIGNEIKNSDLKINRNNEGIKYLLNKNIITPIDWNWKKENDLLKFVRNKIQIEIETGVIESIMKKVSQKVDFVALINDEISTYLLPEGLNHYWNNIGFEDGNSEEAKYLYSSFKKVFSFIFTKKLNKPSIHEIIAQYIRNKVSDIDKVNLITEWYLLSFLSNIIRAEYYINLARITKTLYSPLATRGLIINELIKDDPKEDVYILEGNIRGNSLFLVFIYILEKINWDKKKFIDKVIELKKKDDLLLEYIELLKLIGSFRRDNINDEIQETYLKEKITNFEKKIFSKIEYNNKNYVKLRLFDKLPNKFFNNWL